MKTAAIIAGIVLPFVVSVTAFLCASLLCAGDLSAFDQRNIKGVAWFLILAGVALSGLLTAISAFRATLRTTWIVVGVASIALGIIVASIPLGRVRVSTMIAQNVRQWNANCGEQLSFSLSRHKWANENGKLGIWLEGTISNNSKSKIDGVIVDLQLLNQDRIVVTKRVWIPIEVFPTAKVDFTKVFSAGLGITDDMELEELQRASTQLGEAATWSYDLVAIVPQRDGRIADISGFHVQSRLY